MLIALSLSLPDEASSTAQEEKEIHLKTCRGMHSEISSSFSSHVRKKEKKALRHVAASTGSNHNIHKSFLCSLWYVIPLCFGVIAADAKRSINMKEAAYLDTYTSCPKPTRRLRQAIQAVTSVPPCL